MVTAEQRCGHLESHRQPSFTNPPSTPLSSPHLEGIVPRAKESPVGTPLNERDRAAADDWIRNNMPDPAECSFEDTEEAGSTDSYFFLRYRDSATVVYKVAVYHDEGSQEEPDEQRWLVEPKAYGSRSRPSLHLERVAAEAISTRRTHCLQIQEINGRDWRFQARRLETGIKDRRLPGVC